MITQETKTEYQSALEKRLKYNELDAAIELYSWFERDNSLIELRWTETQVTIVDWRDNDVYQMIELGLLDSRDWKRSAIEYCMEVGVL